MANGAEFMRKEIVKLTGKSLGDAEKRLADEPTLAYAVIRHFDRLIKMIFSLDHLKHLNACYNNEFLHIIHRIVQVKSYGRPFDKGHVDFANWLVEFKQRSDVTELPKIPQNIKVLRYIRQLLESVEFWMSRFHFDRTKTYSVQNREENSEYVDEHSFVEVESYRICRALLILQLFSTLFRYSKNRPETAYDCRIGEQMLFLQSLQPFLLSELDAVYGMIECNLASTWHMGDSISRKAEPLNPGHGATFSGAKLEYFISMGLVKTRRFLTKDIFDAGYHNSAEASRDDFRNSCEDFPKDIGNRFFTRALVYCSEGVEGNDRIIIPTMVPRNMEPWNGAPYGTNGPSWLARSVSDPAASAANRGNIRTLIHHDTHAWNGLAFWENARLTRHFEYLHSNRVSHDAFRVANWIVGPQQFEDWYREMDPPDQPYEVVSLFAAVVAHYRNVLG
ncbi:hypothetical protein F5B19DRAFT_500175 [Rostrohypoxylon terebratum]|nr:hypothetical protein F5B19DRAFT_500175 [Rostrohypoxylon terebratum]